MSDDREKTGRRPRTHVEDDTSRAYQGRRSQTPVRGVAIPVEIDPEVTPPPQTPPSLDGYDVETKISMLRETLEDHAAGLERVWHDRNLREQVQTLVHESTTVNVSIREFAIPAIKNLQGRLDALEQATVRSSAKSDRFFDYEWPQAMKTLIDLGTHMMRIEKDVDRVERTVDGFIKRFEEQTALTTKRFEELKSMDERQEIRLRRVEDFQLALKTKIALISTLAGGGIAAAWELIKHFT